MARRIETPCAVESSALFAAGRKPPVAEVAYPIVSIILVNYNGRDHIGPCLASLCAQAYPSFEVLVVDNHSSDGSAEVVERDFAGVRLIRSGENLGFGRANNLGSRHATGEYLAFLNPDTTVEPDWLLPLVQALQQDPGVGLATAKILIQSQPGRINTCGNQLHFTGVPACRGWMLPRDAIDRSEEVFSVSGAAFVVRQSVFEEIGGFDESFFLYAEDNDLSWKAQLAGYRCLCVPDAVVYHRYELRFGPDKYFYLERNRYQMLLKNLRWRTLTLFLPALALTELVTWGYALLQGRRHVLAKLRAYGWTVSHCRRILAERQAVQRRRKVPDREVLRQFSYRMAYGLASEGSMAKLASRVFDPLFLAMYRVYLATIRW